MSSKTITINPRNANLYFSVEIFDANAAYTWKFINSKNGAVVTSGNGNSKKYEVVQLPRNDANSIGFSLTIRIANDNVKGASMRISVYQGSSPDNLTLTDKFEPTIPANPTTHRIDFKK